MAIDQSGPAVPFRWHCCVVPVPRSTSEIAVGLANCQRPCGFACDATTKHVLSGRHRRCGAAGVFALAAVLVQVAHSHYDRHFAPMSFYLSGPHGPWLQAGYGALAAAIAAQAWLPLAHGARAPADRAALALFDLSLFACHL